MNELLILYNNSTAAVGQTLIWEQGENNSHVYDIVVNDQTNQPISLDGCSVGLIFEMEPGRPIQIATSVSGYIATAKIPGEATQKPGKYTAWVQVIDPAQSRDIRTNSLTIIVKSNPLDIPPDTAQPYFGELAQLILDAQKAINDLEALIPVSVANGGTGATSAAAARTNLGAASSNHTHGLSSASITGILPVSKGGTGASSAQAARTSLQAVGTNDIIDVAHGGTGASVPDSARVNLGFAKQLWSGSWSKGTIVVPDTDKYSLFRIAMDGEGTVIIASKNSNFIRGGNSFPNSASSAVQYHFAATFSGTTWTFGFCTKNNVGSTSFNTNTVVSITGIL